MTNINKNQTFFMNLFCRNSNVKHISHLSQVAQSMISLKKLLVKDLRFKISRRHKIKCAYVFLSKQIRRFALQKFLTFWQISPKLAALLPTTGLKV